MYDHINKNSNDISDDEDNENDTGKNPNQHDDNVDDEVSNGSDSSINSTVEVYDDFIFTGYMAFYLWGPFASPKDRLLMFGKYDAPKNSGVMSRTVKRKAKLEEKELDQALDPNSLRGFSTDQRIIIEGLILQQKIQKQKDKESSMVASVAHERAISR